MVAMVIVFCSTVTDNAFAVKLADGVHTGMSFEEVSNKIPLKYFNGEKYIKAYKRTDVANTYYAL
jgi:hypothetical protein